MALCMIAMPADLLAWQQRVRYTMEVSLVPATQTMTGAQRLVYINNSPDTLREIYYHLFYEAFRPGTMMDFGNREAGRGGAQGLQMLPAAEQGSVRIETLRQDGAALDWSIDETILHTTLAQPLLPGDSTTLALTWTTHIPRLLRRGGWESNEGVDYSMAQWYPKLAAYDEHGWHPDEYVGREFYGVFGAFDVAITLPAEYVVGGTGTVMNPHEVGCGYELGAVDTLIESPASGSGLKTWRFHAENVHDFAWVADRDYIHQITRWHDVAIHLLYKKGARAGWKNMATFTRAVVDYFSARVGNYAWPQLTIAMAGDRGMEYPQLVMMTGYRGEGALVRTLAHEIAHQWFYGMLANNETQEAWLDEGMAQYLTDEAARNLFGLGRNPYTGVKRSLQPWDESSWTDLRGYYRLATVGYDEALNIYHDRFREESTAGLAYYKGEMILRMLQYMLGDSLFDVALHRYFDRWRFRHPSTRDFERVVEEVSGMRLDWFFNQWVGTTKTLDYAVDDLSSEPEGSGYVNVITLSNRDEAIMPLDLTLLHEDGTRTVATIPVEEWKKPGADLHLPRWKWTSREYSARFTTTKRVVRVEIDTSLMLPDLDRTNNIATTGFASGLLPPSHVGWWTRWDLARPIDRYSIRLRPSLWYTEADGAQIGMVADGGYAFDLYNARLGAFYNTRSRRIDYDIRYRTSSELLGRLTDLSFLATNVDGVQRWRAEIGKTFHPYYLTTTTTHRAALFAEREVLIGGSYPNALAPWSGGACNTIGLGYNLTFVPRRSTMRMTIRSEFEASFASASDFAQWRLSGESRMPLGSLTLLGNLFLGATAGTPPAQRLFNAAGATSRDMHANTVHRMLMNIQPKFAARNHLLLPTQGFMLSLTETDSLGVRYGENIINGRISLGNLNPFSRLIAVPLLEEIDLSAYVAGGWIFPDVVTLRGFKRLAVEAGAVASVDLFDLLPEWVSLALDAPSPIRLSVWLPVYARSPLLTRDGFAYRWALGVSM